MCLPLISILSGIHIVNKVFMQLMHLACLLHHFEKLAVPALSVSSEKETE